jgi:hypothetical protein
MSIKDAINSGIKVGDIVKVRQNYNPFSKPIRGKVQYINLTGGTSPPSPKITISCLDDICKQSEDRYGKIVTSSKSFGNDYCVIMDSPTTGGKSRKYKKSKKSKKSRKSRK